MTSDPNSGNEDLETLLESLKDFDSPRETCFLCGCSLLTSNYTKEHVIPAWVQERYDLSNQRLILLNGSDIPYRQLTVPCCEQCNWYRLKPLEDSMSQAAERGRQAVLSLGKHLLFLWLGKIFYGILYKELSLLFDRKDPGGHTIITQDFIQRYRMHRFFLQQAQETVKLVDFHPGSIFVFSMQPLPERRMEWDLCDNVDSMFIGCRVGRVGLIATLADGGAQQPFEESYSDIVNLDLHPIQFRELCAYFSYRSSLATRTPKYITIPGRPHIVHQLSLGGLSSKPMFEDWVPKEYVHFLAHYVGEDARHLYSAPDDKVMTWLHTPEGQPHFLSFREFPVFPKTPVS